MEWISCAVHAFCLRFHAFKGEQSVIDQRERDSEETLWWDLISKSGAWRAEGSASVMTPEENLLEPQFPSFPLKFEVSPPVLVSKAWQLLKCTTSPPQCYYMKVYETACKGKFHFGSFNDVSSSCLVWLTWGRAYVKLSFNLHFFTGTLSTCAPIQYFSWPSNWHLQRKSTCTKGFVTVVNEHMVKDNLVIKPLDLSM